MYRRMTAIVLALCLLCARASAGSTIAISMSDYDVFAPDEVVTIYFDAPVAGLYHAVVLDESGAQCATIAQEYEAVEGLNQITWNGTEYGVPLPTGDYFVAVSNGTDSVEIAVHITSDTPGIVTQPVEEVVLQPAAAQAYPAPNLRSTYALSQPHEGCYWCTPMDITNQAAVWAMLTAPVMVVDVGQKEQVIIRQEASDSAEGVGVVTGTSQSVHVLETLDNGWSLIECYSSSFHDSKVKAWNAYVQGYIKTSQLKKVTPRTEYGIVIDKLTQELYLFSEGKLMTTLKASTGLYNSRQPYNETRSGEFLLVSPVGDFRSDAMICGMALRFNGGDLLHEVPHVKNADGTKNYRSTEFKLGTRASHGCIRVQRLKNADGINMTWLWNNLRKKMNTKLVIWEDYAGRSIDIPDAQTPVYYNPNGGSSYHSVAECPGVRDKFLPLTAFTYGELEDSSYSKLTSCDYCNPPRRVAEIEEINKAHETVSPGMVSDYHGVN